MSLKTLKSQNEGCRQHSWNRTTHADNFYIIQNCSLCIQNQASVNLNLLKLTVFIRHTIHTAQCTEWTKI